MMRARPTDAERITALEGQLRVLNLRLVQTPKSDELRRLVRHQVFDTSRWGRAAFVTTVGLGAALGAVPSALLEHTSAPLRVAAAIAVAVFGAWALKPRVDQLFVALFERASQRRRRRDDDRSRTRQSPHGHGSAGQLSSVLAGAPARPQLNGRADS
jgi:cytochrome c biogenesis protein CcdA